MSKLSLLSQHRVVSLSHPLLQAQKGAQERMVGTQEAVDPACAVDSSTKRSKWWRSIAQRVSMVNVSSMATYRSLCSEQLLKTHEKEGDKHFFRRSKKGEDVGSTIDVSILAEKQLF